jgi:hypothetical protein
MVCMKSATDIMWRKSRKSLVQDQIIENQSTYPVQQHVNVSSSVDDCCFAAQFHNFAKHADEFVLELLEVRGQDAGGFGGGPFCYSGGYRTEEFFCDLLGLRRGDGNGLGGRMEGEVWETRRVAGLAWCEGT